MSCAGFIALKFSFWGDPILALSQAHGFEVAEMRITAVGYIMISLSSITLCYSYLSTLYSYEQS